MVCAAYVLAEQNFTTSTFGDVEGWRRFDCPFPPPPRKVQVEAGLLDRPFYCPEPNDSGFTVRQTLEVQ